jgi:arsenite-transporting ATPase
MAFFHFFGGKGGVGKTTCAAAHALRACDGKARVLLVSTDPAHSLGDALGVPVGPRPRALRVGRRTLHALELDADRALERWMRSRAEDFRVIARRGTYLDDEDVDQVIGLSAPGVDELIGLLELRRLSRLGKWDVVVVDTAPTGHTIRLLETPEALERIATVLDEMQAKHRLLAESISGRYRPDAADDTILEIADEATGLRAMLGDKAQCKMTWILLPEAMSIAETDDALKALAALGMEVRDLLINRVTAHPSRTCPQCSPRVHAEAQAIAAVRGHFRKCNVVVVRATEDEPRGTAALLLLGRNNTVARTTNPRIARTAISPLAELRRASVSELLPKGRSRLLFFGGKGGVGKTTCAAAAAIALARTSLRVLVLSTDPAHSLADVLAMQVGDEERRVPGIRGLYARELDARAAFDKERARYHEAIGATFRALIPGSRMEASYDRAVMEDLIDLAPSGIDEIFAIVTLIDALNAPAAPRRGLPATRRYKWDTIVVDTAPTGHTLRLLAMPRVALEWTHAVLRVLLKYQRLLGLGNLAADVLSFARRLRSLETLLRDPSRTSFVAVTRAAELPRAETTRLLTALEGHRISCPAVVVDAITVGTCERCRRTAFREAAQLDALARSAQEPRSSTARARAILVAPAVYPPPYGVEGLARWVGGWRRWHRTGTRAKEP